MRSEKIHFFHPADGESTESRNITFLEKRLDELLSPYAFIRNQVTTSSILLICIIAALILANSPLANYYQDIVNLKFGLHFGSKIFIANLQHWINDGLLTLFFFVIGLEIKQQMLIGVLSNHKRALVIICAALGGMLCPALLFYLFNQHTSASHAWGIPIATDTALALGILMLLKNRVPSGLFIFLTALAIIDDVGAVLIIALFYTQQLNGYALLAAALTFGVLILFNLLGIRQSMLYLCFGILLWLNILLSGVHASIAGILLAMTIPARSKTGPRGFIRQVRKLLRRFEIKQLKSQRTVFTDASQHAIVYELEKLSKLATTPLQRWKAILDKPVVLFILPVFGFINAGIPYDLKLLALTLTHPISLGISLGLIVGKAVGIFAASWCAVKFVGGALPPQVTFRHLAAISLLCGIGFTMSMFIANLSFDSSSLELTLAKASILTASCIAGVSGYLCLRWVSYSALSQQ